MIVVLADLYGPDRRFIDSKLFALLKWQVKGVFQELNTKTAQQMPILSYQPHQKY